MKRNIILSLFCAGVMMTHATHGMMLDAFQVMQEMDHLFDQMMTRAQGYSLQAPDYSVQMSEKDDLIFVSLSLGKDLASNAISIEVEDNTLYVTVKKGNDRLELTLSDQRLVIASSTHIARESTDDKGQLNNASIGSAHSSQVLTLPARIDLYRKSPKADFVDGVLTLTLAKKGSYKIPVHVGQVDSAPVQESSLEETYDK